MTIHDIEMQLEYLADKIELINGNLQFNIATFLAVLAIALAILSLSAGAFFKQLFDKSFARETKKIDEKIESKAKEEFEKFDKKKADREELVKYEEGTWTPELSSGDHNYLIQKGTYVRIKDLAILQFHVAIDGKDPDVKNADLIISGIPFAAMSQNSYGGSINSAKGIKQEGQILLGIQATYIPIKHIKDSQTVNCKISDIEDVFEIEASIIYNF